MLVTDHIKFLSGMWKVFAVGLHCCSILLLLYKEIAYALEVYFTAIHKFHGAELL